MVSGKGRRIEYRTFFGDGLCIGNSKTTKSMFLPVRQQGEGSCGVCMCIHTNNGVPKYKPEESKWKTPLRQQENQIDWICKYKPTKIFDW